MGIYSEDQERILSAIRKAERISKEQKEIRISIKEARRDQTKISSMQRVKNWFLEHPEITVSPTIAKNNLDVNGSLVPGFPRVSYENLRKNILPRLREEGIVRYHWDPLNARYVPEWYELNDSVLVFEKGKIPDIQYHGIKIEINNPQHQITNRKGKTFDRILPPRELKRILQANPFIKVQYVENKQNHTWSYRGSWRNRDISFEVHHGKSNLVEIWIKATWDPLNLEDLLNLDKDLHLLWGDIWIHSEVLLTEIGLNRDFPSMKLYGLQCIHWEHAKGVYLQLYQKGKAVRSEVHFTKPFDWSCQLLAHKRQIQDGEEFNLGGELEGIKKELSTNQRLIELLEARLGEVGEHQLAQSLEVAKLTGSLRSFLDILEKPASSKNEFYTSGRGGTVDPTGYS